MHKDIDAKDLIGHVQERKHGETVSGLGNGMLHNLKQILHSFT